MAKPAQALGAFKPVVRCWDCGGWWHQWEQGERCVDCGFPIESPDAIRRQGRWRRLKVECYPMWFDKTD